MFTTDFTMFASPASAASPDNTLSPLEKALVRIAREFGVFSHTSLANDSVEIIKQKVTILSQEVESTMRRNLANDFAELSESVEEIRGSEHNLKPHAQVVELIDDAPITALTESSEDSLEIPDSRSHVSDSLSSDSLIERFEAMTELARALNNLAETMSPTHRIFQSPQDIQAQIQKTIKAILAKEQRQALNDGLTLLKDSIGSTVQEVLRTCPEMLYDMIVMSNNVRTNIITPLLGFLVHSDTTKLLTTGTEQGLTMQNIVGKVINRELSLSQKADLIRKHQSEIEKYIAHAAHELCILISASLACYDQQSEDFLPDGTPLTEGQAKIIMGLTVAESAIAAVAEAPEILTQLGITDPQAGQKVAKLAESIESLSRGYKGMVAFGSTAQEGFKALKDNRIGDGAVLFSAHQYASGTLSKPAASLVKPSLKKATLEERRKLLLQKASENI